MRILVLQLARFGDIYQSWPTLRALQRQHSSAELHVLVRERFREALHGLSGIHIHALPTQDILKPVLFSQNIGEEEAHAKLVEFLTPLREQSFNLVVNLSYSPLSSYLTDDLATATSEVHGYTRHSDGHLHIPDDTSSYFYAQVGVGRASRYHLTDLFAATAGVDLSDADFGGFEQFGPRHGVIVHMGASTADKVYPPELWVKALRHLSAGFRRPIVLVGSPSERALSETVVRQVNSLQIENLVGQTELPELFSKIAQAELLIGADSAPIHIASLSRTPTLSLSSPVVNFWETGPLTAGSRILYEEQLQNISPERVAAEALAMIEGQPIREKCIARPRRDQPYELHGYQFEEFPWRLVQALYTDAVYPVAETLADRLAFQRVFELAELAVQQLARWNDLQARATTVKILAQVDALLTETGRLNPRIDPVIQWFETQRLRIPPGDEAQTLAQTHKVFADLVLIASVYRTSADETQELKNAILLCHECAPELREYNMSGVQDSFQTLLSLIHELARHSTKVAAWSSVLQELNTALAAHDYIYLADILQWKLPATCNARLNEKETLSQDVIS